MELELKRNRRGSKSTLGLLTGDNISPVFSLEDVDRFLDDSMTIEEIKKLKVHSETAIPTGRYDVIMTYSPAFKRRLPLLVAVKGYTGIRIHSGRTHKHTAGCLLFGYSYAITSGEYEVISSPKASEDVIKAIDAALSKGEKVSITIKRNYTKE